jgi:predicted PurR-regulated permease PerM
MDERSRETAEGSHRRDDRLTASVMYRVVLLAFGLLVLVLVFPLIANLLLVLLLVVIVAVPMTAVVDRLERLRIPRALGAPLVLIAVLALLAGAVALLVPVFERQGSRLVESVPSTIDSLRRDLRRATHTPPTTAGQDLKRFIDGYTRHPQRLLGPAESVGAGLAGLITVLVVVAITAVYTSIRPEPLLRGVVRLVPPPRRAHARRILHRLGRAYLDWLRGLAIGMVVLWVVTYAGLLIVGLPYAVVFATLTAVAMVVPYYGALVSSIPPILVALTISPGKAVVVAAIYVAAHQLEGHIIEPLVMARAVQLHPAMVAIGVILVERLFGIAGLIVAVPILVTFKILVEELWVRPIEDAYRGRAPPGVSDDVLGSHEVEHAQPSRLAGRGR